MPAMAGMLIALSVNNIRLLRSVGVPPMKSILFLSLGLLLLPGCQSIQRTPAGANGDSAVGRHVMKVLGKHVGHRIEIFDDDGGTLQEIPSGSGSVSVFSNEPNGQDNYRFDEAGIIIRHQRSYGDNFLSGVWLLVE
jgi:hypothetical protein